MRATMVCVGMALAVLVAGCGKSDDDGGRPLLPVPKCEGLSEQATGEFTQIVRALDRAGDIAAVTDSFRRHRKSVEAQLARRDPGLVARVKPVLDAQFSDQALRTRIACSFAGLAGKGGGKLLDEWSRVPENRAILRAIWSRKPAPSEEENAPMTAERKQLLRAIAEAMALPRIQGNQDAVAAAEAAALVASLDATLGQSTLATTKPEVATDAVVDTWLTPALVKIPDDDLADYLNFVESPFASDYYVALAAAFDFREGEWYRTLYRQLREASAPGDLPTGSPGKEQVLAEVRRLLHDVGTPQAAAEATARLLPLERIDPRNPDIFALLAEAAIRSMPPPQLAPDELRAVATESPYFEQAQAHLAKALELSPDHVDAHLWTARLRYLQGRDPEALQSYKRVEELAPEHPLLNLFLGDQFFVARDYVKAARYYLAATAKPEGQSFVHYLAMAHLQMALRKGNRIADYPRYVEAYLAAHPDAWGVRLDYGDYLLAGEARTDKIIAIVDPVPDAWQPTRKLPLLSAALVRKSAERLDKKTLMPTADSLVALRRAISLNPDPRTYAEAICRSGIKLDIVRFAILESRMNEQTLSNAIVVCALRWQNGELVRSMASRAQAAALSVPLAELYGDTPLCYAAATRNVRGFTALAKLQVNPAQKCNNGDTVAERLARMAAGKDPQAEQMASLMDVYFRKQ
jgi:tetratricopeptide (TPR) repeat protein